MDFLMKHQGHFSFLIDVEVDWFTESFVLSRIHDGWTTCSFLHRSISLMVTNLTELISLVMSHFSLTLRNCLYLAYALYVFLIHMYFPSDILMYFYVKLIYIFSVYSGFLLSHFKCIVLRNVFPLLRNMM